MEPSHKKNHHSILNSSRENQYYVTVDIKLRIDGLPMDRQTDRWTDKVSYRAALHN